MVGWEFVVTDALVSRPDPIEHRLDVRAERVMDGAAAGGAFEKFAFRMRMRDRHLEIELKSRDAPGRVLRHVLANLDVHPFKGDPFPIRDDAHHRAHAGTEGCRDKIRRGKGLAPAVIVERGVGLDHVSGRGVSGGAAKAALVAEIDANHWSYSFAGEITGNCGE